MGLPAKRPTPAIEAFDQHHLPQRPVPVQRAREELGSPVAQLPGVPRRRQPVMADVVANVEALIGHPARPCQAPRPSARQPLRVARKLTQPRGQCSRTASTVGATHPRVDRTPSRRRGSSTHPRPAPRAGETSRRARSACLPRYEPSLTCARCNQGRAAIHVGSSPRRRYALGARSSGRFRSSSARVPGQGPQRSHRASRPGAEVLPRRREQEHSYARSR